MMAAFLLSVAGSAQTPPAQNPPAAPCPNQTQPQTQTQTQEPNQTAKPCAPAPGAPKKSAAEQFPFPGQAAKPANPPDSPAPGSTPTTTPSDAAAQHPFPTEPPPKLPGDDSSSSSSSSSSGDDADPARPDDRAFNGDNPPEGTSVHRKLPKPKHIQSDDERVDEDLSVAKFYMRDENYQGAYLRAKEAVSIQPDYSATHFALAQIAEKMKKKEEAIAEYQAYLKLDPDGENARDAKKALAELSHK